MFLVAKEKFGKLTPRQYVPLRLETSKYILKTVENKSEFRQLIRLRYQIFYREFAGYKLPLGIDIDRYDQDCDHLIVVEKGRKKVIGTYRIRCSDFTDRFYCETEFHLDSFLDASGTKIELSRACVHRDHRNGTVMQLLWKGIGQYLRATRADFLFGMSSIPFKSQIASQTSSKKEGLLSEKRIRNEYNIFPKVDFRITEKEDFDRNNGGAIPALLIQYFRAGAHVALPPAIDRKLRCYDLFTILKTNDLNDRFARKFL